MIEEKASWHTREASDVIEGLRSSILGISPEEGRRRLEEHGPNRLTEKKKRSSLLIFLDQFRDFMVIVLLVAAVISGVIGEVTDTIAILIIVMLNAVIGFVQEFRAEKAIEALKKMAAPTAAVVRNGQPLEIAASEIVPGDIITLEAGKIVPADLRLVNTALLRVDEAALTGESFPVEKGVERLSDEILPVGDRTNMVYRGTSVSYGRGAGITVATGMDTELGRIAGLLQEEEQVRTPLQKRLNHFGRKLAITILVICAVIFAFGIMRGETPLLMFLTAVTLAVAAIPEALPAVVTISLAIGAKKLVKQSALIRKLPAVETLGSVTYICSDKTGTLTVNRMTVEEIFVGGEFSDVRKLETGTGEKGEPSLDSQQGLLLTAMALSNDTKRDMDGGIIGDPTENALYSIALNSGFDKALLEGDFPRIAEIPFDAERKCMTTIHRWRDGKYISFTKGASEVIGEISTSIISSGGGVPASLEGIQDAGEEMALKGLRVIGFAMRVWDELPMDVSPDSMERGLTLLGLAGMMDPPRDEVMAAVSHCRTAGIKPVMITGDHPITAKVIAERIGIIEDGSEAMITGMELSSLSEDELDGRVGDISLYARIAPEQKLRIVKSLQKRGEFVAMTGDGVNDAPALKRADIGIAMGITGTDVSKEASHMILLDDNFTTIVKTVREGRRIYDNIRKFIKYTMTSNSGEIWTIFLAPFLGLPLPLLPIHILWINLVTDGLPGLALAAEPEEREVMKRPPRHAKESIFAHGMGAQMVWIGLLMGGVSIFSQAWSLHKGYNQAHWQTMVFTVLCLSQLGNVLAIRSERESLFKMGLLTNKPLFAVVLASLALQMATIYVPVLNPVFKTAPLSLSELSLAVALSSLVFIAVEIEKWIKRSIPLRTEL